MPAYKDDKTGKWYVQFRYMDWTGERKQKRKRGFNLKREAEQWERDFLEQYDFSNKQKTKQCSGISFENFVKIYFDDISIKNTTARSKEAIFRLHITPYFQNLKIEDITPSHIVRWQKTMENKNLSPTYLRTINIQLSSLFNHAERFYGLKQHPCRVTQPIGSSQGEEMKFWTLDQYQKVLDVVPKTEVRFRLAFQILFWSGCRIGELLALKPQDIEQENTLRIDQTYNRLDRKDNFNTPKTRKSERKVSIPDFLYQELLDYTNSLYGIKENDRIFMFTALSFSRNLKKYANLAGVEAIRTHDLRHSHASYLIDQNVNIMVISKRLGHSSVEITWNTYGHLYPEKDATELSRVVEAYKNNYLS